jgi:hypothetical protein
MPEELKDNPQVEKLLEEPPKPKGKGNASSLLTGVMLLKCLI